MKCTAPKCKRTAAMKHPKVWCKKHWDEWWNWPENKEQPEWMDRDAAYRPKPIVCKKTKKNPPGKRTR